MGQDDGTAVKYFLIRIPFRSYAYFKKVGPKVIENLEQKFKYPIIVIANRTIQSKRAKTHQSQKRPRSRTLKAVHNALLNDIVVPSSITGRSTRVAAEGGKTERIFLDPLDKHLVESKIDCMAHAYAKLTTHKISIEFSKPTSFQKKKLRTTCKSTTHAAGVKRDAPGDLVLDPIP